MEVWQIGNEGGFLPAPINLTELTGGRLLMALAERADLIVDFTHVPLGSHVLANIQPGQPFGGGEPESGFEPSDPETTGQIMEFRVVRRAGSDRTTPVEFLQVPTITPLGDPDTTRRLALVEEMSALFDDAPAAALLGTVEGNPQANWRTRCR